MVICNSIKPVLLLAPHTLTATTKSLILDRYGWDATAFWLALGAAAGTLDGSNLITPSLEVSDTTDEADFAAADDDDVLFAPTVVDAAAEASRIQRIEYTGDARYLRLVLTPTGTVSIPVTVIGLLGGASFATISGPDVGSAAT